MEDGPCGFGVAGAELGEAREGGVGGNGDGEGVRLLDDVGGEDVGVCFADLGEEGGGVDVLRELEWGGAGEGGVGCYGRCDFFG